MNKKRKKKDKFHLEILALFLNRILANRIQQYIKRVSHQGQLGFSPQAQTDSVFKNALIIFSILTSQRRKKQVVDFTYADMTFDIFQYLFLFQEEKLLEE